MRFAVASILLPALAQADYPAPLVWKACDSSYCATLEFCNSGASTYGYRPIGDVSPCGSKPGPLIRMQPGNTYKLTLRNSATDPSLHTNIHTHGLHIVGDGDSDNVVRGVEGGSCLVYTYKIASDHPGGTYWYHPHYHAETMAQTDGGAFGMIIIDDNYNQLNAWAHPENEKLLQISSASSGTLGNGNAPDLIQVEADRWYRLRVSVVVPGAFPGDIIFSGCSTYKVASDGVWHSAPLTTYGGNTFKVTGASRADFAIKCPAGSFNIKWGRSNVANIQAGSFLTGTGMGGDDLGTAPPRPYSLDSISGADVPADNVYSVGMSAAQINGQSWNEHVGLGNIAFDQVHEWTIGGSGPHPFHLHLYHMLIVSPGGCGFHHENEFYDTISVKGSCTVRFKTADFGQRMIMHCHVLNHEDQGAITWMNVTGNIPADKLNTNYTNSYACPAEGNGLLRGRGYVEVERNLDG